ncbi:hypothetical protein Pla123a_14180 [Posidoniimonas polymericola]|uniref:Glycosyltransferase subfamily 4-like N-terminal domain-containing protein n=1 Tax=Posidoniimonas polymericola TaxID=2528002 RepID=A0A5C5YRS0_9BACT|nr:glycosyltransferase family 4 protein [Posidoniimonas polymericola]TWT77622.1 hypothetical protein Pla123a_14180 [Posidoniimonas polymericola]
MRVLLATCSLVASGGVETHVQDLARQLIARGHWPVVFAPRLGAFSQRLREQSIPVLDDLTLLADRPDVIHGHYGLSLLAAMLRFPTAPAVQTCHAWHWRGDVPPNLPNVRRRIAVDMLCRERLVCGFGYREDEIDLLLNGVDLERFARRRAPARRPQRAAVFGNYLSENAAEPIISACRQAGIAVDLIGRRFGADCAEPERRLPDYDVVFAKGRCAWEALASGCAVVVADAAGLGPLVTSADLQQQRLRNFGRRLLVDPLTLAGVAARLARYDPDDAALVAERVRRENSLELMVDQLLAIYDDAIHDEAPRIAVDEHARLAEYAERLCRELAVDEPRPISAGRRLRKQATARADRFARQAVRTLKTPWNKLRGRAT